MWSAVLAGIRMVFPLSKFNSIQEQDLLKIVYLVSDTKSRYEIDKKLGMSGLQAVQEIGIEKYNEECRSIVMRYATEWRQTIERLGRWIDFDNDYKVRSSTSGFLRPSVNVFFFSS